MRRPPVGRSEANLLWLALGLLTLRLTDGSIVGNVWLEVAAWIVIATALLDGAVPTWIRRHEDRARAFVARQRAKR